MKKQVKKEKKQAKKVVVEKKVKQIAKKQKQVKVVEQQEEVKLEEKTSTLPVYWVINERMFFGLINENFDNGSIFKVDWKNRKMRCENNGRIYHNVRDLEIAFKLGKAEPYNGEDPDVVVERQHQQEMAKKLAKSEALNEMRATVIESDSDLIGAIDISGTKRQQQKQEVAVKVTPRDQETILRETTSKPKMEIIGAEDGGVKMTPILRRPEITTTQTIKVAKRERDFDVDKAGQARSSEIRRQIENTKIEIEDGMQKVRGMPLVSDGGRCATSGTSRNSGLVINADSDRRQQAREAAAVRAEQLRKDLAAKKSSGSKLVNTSGGSLVDNDALVEDDLLF